MSQYAKYSPNGGTGGSGGVSSINSQTGPAISIVGGSGITVGSSGNTITITNTGSGSTTENVEYRTLSTGEAVAKALTLAATPLTAAKTVLDTVGGTSQIYGTDYVVAANVLTWSALGLDGLLAAGDVLRIEYFS